MGRSLVLCIDLPALISQHCFTPVDDPLTLAEGIWLEDENVDDFPAAHEAWQHEGQDDSSPRR